MHTDELLTSFILLVMGNPEGPHMWDVPVIKIIETYLSRVSRWSPDSSRKFVATMNFGRL